MRLKPFLILFNYILFSSVSYGQLSGLYTINPAGSGSSNYTSFSSAIYALSTSGVTGPVTFNVVSGVYYGQFTIPQVSNASISNPITFQADPANNSPVVLTYGANNSYDDFIINLSGAKNIVIKGFKFLSTGPPEYCRAIMYSGAATNIAILDNEFIGTVTINTNWGDAAIYPDVNSAAFAQGFWKVLNNTFSNFQIGIDLRGNGWNYPLDTCLIQNNKMTLRDFVYDITYSKYVDIIGNHFESISGRPRLNAEIKHCLNTVQIIDNVYDDFINAIHIQSTPPFNTSNLAYNIKGNEIISCSSGIRIWGTNSTIGTLDNINDIEIENNKIIVTSDSLSPGTFEGIRLAAGAVGSSLDWSHVRNNMISINGTFTTGMGLYVEQCPYIEIGHNSIVINAGNTQSSALYTEMSTSSTVIGPGPVVVKGNILINNNGGRIFWMSGLGSTTYLQSNHNIFHSTSISPFNYQWGSVSNLANWQTATGGDSSSIWTVPMFVSQNDLHIQDSSANGLAAPIPNLNFDIDGDSRSLTNPDIGADEYTPSTCFTPQTIQFSNVLDTSLSTSWISPNSSVIVGAQVKVRPEKSSTWTIFWTTSTSLNINGLNPSTWYEVSIREICTIGDTGIWSTPSRVKTQPLICYSVTALPFIEDFSDSVLWNNNVYHPCWNIQSSGVPHWDVSRNGTTPSGDTGPNGASPFIFLEVTGSTTVGLSASCELPPISVSDSILKLTFDYFMYGMTMGNLYVECKNSSSGWIRIDTISGQQQLSPNDPWATRVLEFQNPSPGGTTFIRFVGATGSSYAGDICIDNIKIEAVKLRVNLTFQVDMQWEVLNNAIADSVHLYGSFQGWDPSSHPLTDSDGDNVWSATFPIKVNQKLLYKFVNGSDEIDAESSANLSQCGEDSSGYKRIVFTETNDTILPVVCFAKCYECALGTDETHKAFSIAPNPSVGYFNLSRTSLSEQVNLQIINPLGQIIENQIWNAQVPDFSIDLTKFPSGMYIVQLNSATNTTYLKAVVQND